MRELDTAAAALEPAVSRVLGSHPPLGERIRIRQLQQAFVLHRVLAKKAWVSEGFNSAACGQRSGLDCNAVAVRWYSGTRWLGTGVPGGVVIRHPLSGSHYRQALGTRAAC